MLFHDDRFAKNFAGDLSKPTVNAPLCIYGSLSIYCKASVMQNGFEVEVFFGFINGFEG